MTRDPLITELQPAAQAVAPTDNLAEAGRKIFLRDFLKMLKHEDGSRTGVDIEDVHDMRVATRRLRSALRLFTPYFKAKPLGVFQRRLSKIARALGHVRDLDVMIDDLQKYVQTLDVATTAEPAKPKRTRNKRAEAASEGEPVPVIPPQAHSTEALMQAIAELDERRLLARAELNAMFDGGSYNKFLNKFREFIITPKTGKEADPNTVSLILPTLLFDCLSAVRAYDPHIQGADVETLHALRVEFKRLRYAITFFEDVLHKEAKGFIEQLKTIQDHLGRLNDVVVAQAHLQDLIRHAPDVETALIPYLKKLSKDEAALRNGFPAVWQNFNSKETQSKLALAVVAV
jgi:CHAD domain-containing protein